MDKWLAAIAALIFLLCSLLLLEDLRVLQLPFLSRSNENNAKPIGTLIRQDKDVRRRGLSELAWQDTGKGSLLYPNDSILTLSESSAIIEIGQNGRLELGENTLVVLETTSSANSEQIRLLFKKGRVAAQGSTGALESGEWEMNFDANTKFEIRALDENKFELDVREGKMSITDESGKKEIIDKKSVQLTQNQIIHLTLDPTIQFTTQNLLRVYQHSESQILISWSGNAKKLVVHSQTQTEYDVQNLSSKALQLPYGTYQLHLVSSMGQSEALRLEIRKAPIIHLYAPLPRDRVIESKDISFEWREIDIVSTYTFQISDSTKFEDKDVKHQRKSNSAVFRFEELGRFYWRVLGTDKDGFEIPALYHNEIYSVEDPLEAPEIEDTQRYPAESRMRVPGFLPKLFLLFVDSAFASDDHQYIFEWKTVAGAEKYLIEIDDDPYFQSPEVMSEITQPSYRWSPKNKSVYYWRVAADSRGRMGLFSPVQKTDLSKVHISKNKPKSADPFSVRIAERRPADVEQPDYVDQTDKPKQELPRERPAVFSPQEPSQEIDLTTESKSVETPFTHGWIWYGPQYANRNYLTTGIDEAKFHGLELINFGGSVRASPTSWVGRVTFRYNQSKYVVKDKKTHPFQKDLNISEYDFGYSAVIPKTSVEAGLQLLSRVGLTKTGLETFDTAPFTFFGPTLKFGSASPNGGWGIGSGLFFGNNGFLLPLTAEIWSSPNALQGGTLGLRIEYEYQSADTKANVLKIMLPVGYGW